MAETITTITPLNDNIILEVKKIEPVTSQNGIWVINKETKKSLNIAKVIAIGEGRLLNNGDIVKPKVKVGDTVIYDDMTSTVINLDNNKNTSYVIVKENNILCTM